MKRGELAVLTAIADYIDEHGISPCFKDLLEPTGFSSLSTVHGYVTRLREAELLANHEKTNRALVPTDLGYQALGRPGRAPSELQPNPEKQPRMQVIPRYAREALDWLCTEAEIYRARSRSVPGFVRDLDRWWSKVRRTEHGKG